MLGCCGRPLGACVPKCMLGCCGSRRRCCLDAARVHPQALSLKYAVDKDALRAELEAAKQNVAAGRPPTAGSDQVGGAARREWEGAGYGGTSECVQMRLPACARSGGLQEFQRQERERAVEEEVRAQTVELRRLQAAAEGGGAAAPGPPPRPQAYIPEEEGAPRPFPAAFRPFKPSVAAVAIQIPAALPAAISM